MTLSSQVYGTLLIVSAATTFALVAFIVRQDTLQPTVAAEARFLVCWLISVVFMFRYRSERNLNWFGPEKIRWILILRGFLTCGFVTLWWAALPMVPLGDCIAVVYCAPLLTVIMSRIALGEKVLTVFPIQAILAILGMTLIVEPPFLMEYLDAASVGKQSKGEYTLVIAAMIVGSITPLVTRQTNEASWIEVEHVTNFLAVFVLNPFIFCMQQMAAGTAVSSLPDVNLMETGIIMLAALGSFVGVAMETQGYQMAEPGKATMFRYLEIPFAYLLQHVGTQDEISRNSMIGASLVLGSCIIGAIAQMHQAKESSARCGQCLQEVLEAEVDTAASCC